MHPMTTSASRLVPVLALLVASGCGSDGAAAGDAATVRDSAGVRIVESARPAWGDERRWVVDEEPAVEVGMVDGPAEYQLSEVRGAVRLADGGIVVAGADARELRFYDAEGTFVRRAGGPGGGPGEFQTLDGLLPYRGDSVAAWDARSRRLSVFAADGTLGRAVTVRELAGISSWLRGTFADGSFVVEPAATAEAFLRMQPGERRDTAAYLRYTAAGDPSGTVARLPDREVVVSRDGGVVSQENVLFGRDSYLAAAGERAYAGSSDGFRLDVLDPQGRPLASIRRAGEPRPVRRGDLESARAEARRRSEEASARVARITGAPPKAGPTPDLPARSTVPAFDALLVDAGGNLWVREHQVSPAESGRWQVFDGEGAWLGTVDTPAGLTLLQVGDDWVLGRARDELDVEYVRLHPLRRS